MIQRGERTEMGIRICVGNRDEGSRFREVMPRPEPGAEERQLSVRRIGRRRVITINTKGRTESISGTRYLHDCEEFVESSMILPESKSLACSNSQGCMIPHIIQALARRDMYNGA
jgi:hypothetical protein